MIQLRDADTMSSLLFVKQKLQSIGMNLEFTREQAADVERLGGRASDLEIVSMMETWSRTLHRLILYRHSLYINFGMVNELKMQSRRSLIVA